MKIQINKIKTNYFSVGSISPLRNGFHQSRKLVDQVGQQPQIDKKQAQKLVQVDALDLSL